MITIPRPRLPRHVPFWGMAVDFGRSFAARAARCWRYAHEGKFPVRMVMEARLQHQLRRTAVALQQRVRR